MNRIGDVAGRIESRSAGPRKLGLCSLVLIAWGMLSEGLVTAIVTGVFYSAVIVPIWLVLGRRLNKLGLCEPLVSFHAFALTWILTCFLFFVRKYFSKYEAAFDAIIVIGIPALCYFDPLRRRPFATELRLIGQRLLSGRYAILFSLIIIPLLFFLIRLGNEVVEGAEVVYYGQLYIDFGVLKGITNLLVASDFMPEGRVFGTGPLSYHWLFFAVPAWNSDLFGLGHDMNGVLAIANYVATIFLYRCLSHAVALIIRTTNGIKRGAWADAGALVVLFAMNVRYFHEAAFALLNWPFLDLGYRNRLILSLPNSLNIFGNVTFAIALVLVVTFGLHYWSKTANKWHLWLSGFWLSVTLSFSATLVPGVAIGVGLACLLNRIARPIYSLLCFAVIGAVGALAIALLGVFDSQSAPPKIIWDGGQFLKNCVLASPVFLFVIGNFSIFGLRNTLWDLFVFIGFGLSLVPSFLILGHTYTASDLSMKSYTAVAAIYGTLAFTIFWGIRKQPATLIRKSGTYIFFMLFILGIVNSSAYAMSSVIMRYPTAFGQLGKIRGENRTTLGRDYYEGLTYLREHSSRSVVLLCEPTDLLVDPVLTISGRRPFLGKDGFIDTSSPVVQTELLFRLKKWEVYKNSLYKDHETSRWFSDRCDYLLVDVKIDSSDWFHVVSIGDMHLYLSARSNRSNVTGI
jgi:hypothetical protein